MLIALEGVDGAGKSTLADAIEAKIRSLHPDDTVERIHSSQLKNDPIDEYALRFEDHVPGSGKHYVIDRLHWGETIYGPLYREKSALTPAGFRWVELYLRARGGTTWHVSASLETIQERLQARGEDYLQSHHVARVWEGFKDVAGQALTCGGTALTDTHTTELWANQIVTEAEYTDAGAAEVFRPEYIGRSIPSALLVGDTLGPSDPELTRAPFAPVGKSCGGYLLEALPEKWWHQIGLVNAHDTDIPSLLESLYFPSVVALGSNASGVLERLGIEHSTVPHPQKVKRFYHARQREYGALIRNATTQRGNFLSWPN